MNGLERYQDVKLVKGGMAVYIIESKTMFWFCLRVPYLLITCKQKNIMQILVFYFNQFSTYFIFFQIKKKQQKKKNDKI